jgi:hypothetical protein
LTDYGLWNNISSLKITLISSGSKNSKLSYQVIDINGYYLRIQLYFEDAKSISISDVILQTIYK